MWMFTSFDAFGRWIGSLIELGLGNLGEKAGDKVPSGRRVDIKQTKRIVKGDMAELHTLYTKLQRFESQAEETCNEFCSRCQARDNATSFNVRETHATCPRD